MYKQQRGSGRAATGAAAATGWAVSVAGISERSGKLCPVAGRADGGAGGLGGAAVSPSHYDRGGSLTK